MRKLSNHMTIHGESYELIKRSDQWAVFSIQGGRRFEVLKIYALPKGYDHTWWISYPERETVSGAGQFMRDGSKFFSSKEQALIYFKSLIKSD